MVTVGATQQHRLIQPQKAHCDSKLVHAFVLLVSLGFGDAWELFGTEKSVRKFQAVGSVQ
jgi:hypothetical protein